MKIKLKKQLKKIVALVFALKEYYIRYFLSSGYNIKVSNYLIDIFSME